MPNLRVYARNRLAERVAEIDDFGQLDTRLLDNGVGAWTLDLPTASPVVPHLNPDQGGGVAGIVITLDGTPIFSGPVLQFKEDALVTRFSGACDNYLLQRHAAIPVTGDTLTVTGVASTAILEMIDAQIGLGAVRPVRIMETLELMADPGIGATVSIEVPRYDTLLSACQQIALDGGGLAFRAMQSASEPSFTEAPAIEFQVGMRVDRRGDAIFSISQGTLENYQHTRQGASANHVFAANGAGGDGTDISPVVEEFDEASIYRFGRVETFLDLPASTDAVETRTKARLALLSGSDRRAVTLTAIETPQMVLGRHYNLGDYVSVIVGSSEVADGAVIREISISITPGQGVSILPMIGTPGMSNDTTTTRLIGLLRDRVAVVERSTGSLAQIHGLDEQAGALDSRTTTVENRADDIDTALIALDTRVDALETADTSLDSRLDAVETAVAAILAPGGVSAAMLASGAAASNLGFTPIRQATGTYTGNGSATRDFTFGFTPSWVQVSRTGKGIWIYLASGRTIEILYDDTQTELTAPIITNGFRAIHPGNNENGEAYEYVAFG